MHYEWVRALIVVLAAFCIGAIFGLGMYLLVQALGS